MVLAEAGVPMAIAAALRNGRLHMKRPAKTRVI
jgi:uncharacterized protein YqfA (UPF0365 family)